MKKKSLIKGATVAGVTGLVVIALLGGIFVGCGHRAYHSGSQDPGMHVEWLSEKIADRLELTTDQKARLEEIVTDLHEKRQEGQEWRKSARQDVINLVRQEQIEQKDIDRLVDMHRQRMDKLITYLSGQIIEFHALLTPEQREKLAGEIEKHEPGHWRQCRYKKW